MSSNLNSINTGGGAINMTNSAIGQENKVSRNHSTTNASADENDISTCEEILEVLQQLLTGLSQAEDIQLDDSKDLKYSVREAMDAVQAQPSKKSRVIDKLASVQKTLESLKNSASSAVTLGQLAKSALVAAGTLL